ncbi:unnamed protein product [Phaeothamnion confervicola]
MERVSIGSYQVGAILLCGLFVYDVFWVFGTEVMVTVAKSIDAPIKLLFPAKFSDPTADPPVKGEFSMLGLGDIVIPGIFIALLLRYDAERAGVPAENGGGEGRRFKKGTFRTSMVAYVGGLAVTLFVMRYFNAAQPALLYLVPACLLASAGAAAARGELRALWRYSEEGDETAADKDKGQDGAGVEGLAESSTVATSAAATTATVSTAPDGTAMGVYHLLGRLHELDQHSLAAQRPVSAALRVHEGDVVARGPLPDASGREPDAAGHQKVDALVERVDPETDVVEGRRVDLGGHFGVEGLHEVDFNGVRAIAQPQNILVHVFFLAAVGANLLNAQHVAPQIDKKLLLEAANCNLLKTQNAKRPGFALPAEGGSLKKWAN